MITFLLRTPHLVKSKIFKLNNCSDGSFRSFSIEQNRSTSGLTERSSAKSGDPLNPEGFLNIAVMESSFDPCDEKVHCMSLTVADS